MSLRMSVTAFVEKKMRKCGMARPDRDRLLKRLSDQWPELYKSYREQKYLEKRFSVTSGRLYLNLYKEGRNHMVFCEFVESRSLRHTLPKAAKNIKHRLRRIGFSKKDIAEVSEWLDSTDLSDQLKTDGMEDRYFEFGDTLLEITMWYHGQKSNRKKSLSTGLEFYLNHLRRGE